MSESAIEKVGRTPRHLWVVGGLGLLWNAMGAVDHVMTQTRNESYMSRFTPEQLDYFYGFPLWVDAVWGIAVWGGVLGALLLLTKMRLASPAFLISLVAMVVSTIHNYVFSEGMKVAGGAFALGFTAVIFLAALGLFLYSRAMQRRRVLV